MSFALKWLSNLANSYFCNENYSGPDLFEILPNEMIQKILKKSIIYPQDFLTLSLVSKRFQDKVNSPKTKRKLNKLFQKKIKNFSWEKSFETINKIQRKLNDLDNDSRSRINFLMREAEQYPSMWIEKKIKEIIKRSPAVDFIKASWFLRLLEIFPSEKNIEKAKALVESISSGAVYKEPSQRRLYKILDNLN